MAAMPPPVLSVVIPALSVDRELRRCVDSVRLVLPDERLCEIVLVVPPARTAEASAAFAREKVVAESRQGVYGAMNDGVQASRGRFLYFLGKDDVVLPGLADAFRLLAERDPMVLFCDVYWGGVGVRRGRTGRLRILVSNICQQGIIYSRRCIERHGPFLRKLRVQADHLLNIRVLWDPETGARPYFAKPIAWYAADGLSHTARDQVFYRVHAAIMRRYLGGWAGCLWRMYKRVRPEERQP